MSSLEKITCGVDKVGKLLSTVNGLVDFSQSRLTSYGERLTVFGNSISQSLNNYGTWFARKSDGALTFYYNAGVGGNTTVQMLARLDDVPNDTTLVSIMEATNDAASAITPLQHAQNIKQIAEYFIGKGIKPVIIMAPPHDDNARSQLVDKMNIYDFVTARSLKLSCFDIWSGLTDASNGSWIAGASDDGTHPNPSAEKTAGYLLCDKYKGLNYHIPLPRNNLLTDATMPNTNPCFIDATGVRPARWTTNGSQNSEALAVTGLGIGNTWSTNWVNSSVFLNSSRFDVVAGDEWLFVMRFGSVVNSGSPLLNVYLEYDTAIGGVDRVYFMREVGVSVEDCTLSLNFVVPAGVSTIRFCVNTSSSGTYNLDVNIAQAQMYNLSQYTI